MINRNESRLLAQERRNLDNLQSRKTIRKPKAAARVVPIRAKARY